MPRLPTLCNDDDQVPPDVQRVAEDSTERGLSQAAWEMVEIWDVPAPVNEPDTRFSAEWLRHKGWQVAHVENEMARSRFEGFLAAVAARGHQRLLLTSVAPRRPELGAVWSMPLEWLPVTIMVHLYQFAGRMVFTPQRDFALLFGDEDIATLAGPPAFLRAALGDLAEVERIFQNDIVEEYDDEGNLNGTVYIRGYLEHYAPFLAR